MNLVLWWENLIAEWNSAPPTIKRAIIGLLKAFKYSSLFILGAYIILWYCDRGDPNKAVAITVVRLSALVDSVLGGVLAFAMLGVFTFITSIRRPEEEKLDDRISFLFSARGNESPKAREYLQDQVTLLGAIVRVATFRFTFLELSQDKKLVKVLMQVDMNIVNLMKHDEYSQVVPLRISVSDIHLDMDLGTVHAIKTVSFNEDGTIFSERDWTSGERLQKSKSPFEKMISLAIPPSGHLNYSYSASCWNSIEDVYSCRPNRFAERLVLEVHNQSGMNADLTPKVPLKVDERTIKDAESEHIIHNTNCRRVFEGVPPTTRVAFGVKLS